MGAMTEIRRCRPEDLRAVMDFIDRHWRRGHVLATSRALMDWQYGDADGYNILCSWGGEGLSGLLGYIPSRRYDPALAPDNTLWLALWKVRGDIGTAGLGLRLLNALPKVESQIALGVNGINPAHPPMYRALGWKTGELQQYFAVNLDAPRQLICAPEGAALPYPRAGRAMMTRLGREDLLALAADRFAPMVPRKSPAHFVSRFLEHPFYQYQVFLVEVPGRCPALLAARIAVHAGARALRIVDFLGDPGIIGEIGGALADLLRDYGCEYADFCQFGLPPDLLAASGLIPVDPDGEVTVPTYFEPFVARNGRIHCAFRYSGLGPLLLCRADGDQDRPNRIQGSDL
jgi:hypothetical protein